MPDLYRLAARRDDDPFAGCGVPPRERCGEGDGLIHGGGGGRRSESDIGPGGDVDGDDAACRCLIGAVAGEGGVVGACAGGAKARGEGDLADGVGGLGGVVVADAVEIVVDGDGLRREGGCAVLEGGGEGDGLVDGGGGGGRGDE